MNILYFHQHFSTPSGSTGNRSYEMARRLVERGYQVTMVCGSYAGGDTGLRHAFSKGVRRGEVDGIQIIEFELAYSNQDSFIKRIFIFMRFVRKSIALIFKEHYDLVFATSTPLTAGIPGMLARWVRRKPFVFEVRDLWPELPRAMGIINNRFLLYILKKLERGIYRSARGVIGLSPGIVDGIIQEGVPKERVYLIPNGCDLAIFDAVSENFRPSQVEKNDLLALYAGTHGLANGLHAVLDAARVLKTRHIKNIKFVLVGQGQLKSTLQTRALNEGLDNVIFLDSMPKKSLAGLMKNADLGLQILANIPAFYNGTSPNKFFDYLSCSLPVLTNYPGWIASMIENHECGFVVPPNDPERFAEALVFAAANKTSLKTMGMNARALAETHFNRSILADRWVDCIEKT